MSCFQVLLPRYPACVRPAETVQQGSELRRWVPLVWGVVLADQHDPAFEALLSEGLRGPGTAGFAPTIRCVLSEAVVNSCAVGRGVRAGSRTAVRGAGPSSRRTRPRPRP